MIKVNVEFKLFNQRFRRTLHVEYVKQVRDLIEKQIISGSVIHVMGLNYNSVSVPELADLIKKSLEIVDVQVVDMDLGNLFQKPD